MRSDGDAFCGCLPWARQRAPIPSSTRRASSASVAAGGSRARSIVKSSKEPVPSKWRSQAGTSETSSTEGGSETGNGPAFNISATAFGPDDEPAVTGNAGGRGARSSIGTQPRYGSQVQPPGPASGFGANGKAAIKSTESGVLARPEAAYAPADGPRVATGGGGGDASTAAPAALSSADAAGLADTALRLQGLQERFRQRAGRSGSALGASAAAVSGGQDDQFYSDQMQCDSFTYNASMYGGRRSSNGGRLGPLPPLPASPARAAGGPGGAVGVGGGLVVRNVQAKLDQGGLMVDKRPKGVQGTTSPDLSPVQSIVMAHIPGSLPSVTQPQASPGAMMRIHPLSPAWDDTQAPQALVPSASPPPMAAAAAPPPKQPRLSWSDKAAMYGEAHGGAAGAAAAAQGRSSNHPRGNRVRFLPQQETEEEEAADAAAARFESPVQGHAHARFAGVSGDGSPAGPRAGGTSPAMRHSNAGGVHRPAGYSSAAAPVLPLGVRQLARMTSGGAASSRGMERPSSAISCMTVEAFGAGDYGDDSAAVISSPSCAPAEAREGAGAEYLTFSPSTQRIGESGGRYSLPLYDSIAPGAVLAKPPSFGPALGEPRSTPGCIEPRVVPVQLEVEAPSLKTQASSQRHSLQLLAQPSQPPQLSSQPSQLSSQPPQLSSQPPQLSCQPSQLHRLQAGPSQQRLQAAASPPPPPSPQAGPSQQRLQAAASPPPPPSLQAGPSQQRLQAAASPPPPPSLQAGPSQQRLQAAASPPPPQSLLGGPSQQRLQAAASPPPPPSLQAGPSQQRLQAAASAPPQPREEEPRSAPVEALPKRAFAEGPASVGAASEGGEAAKDLRPAARLAQQRMAAARQNEEMLTALLASSRRTLDVGQLLAEPAGSAAAELERLGRVQDAVSRLEGIRAAPAPGPGPAVAPPAPAPAAAQSSRALDSRTGSNENAITDFAGMQPPAPNPALGVKPW